MARGKQANAAVSRRTDAMEREAKLWRERYHAEVREREALQRVADQVDALRGRCAVLERQRDEATSDALVIAVERAARLQEERDDLLRRIEYLRRGFRSLIRRFPLDSGVLTEVEWEHVSAALGMSMKDFYLLVAKGSEKGAGSAFRDRGVRQLPGIRDDERPTNTMRERRKRHPFPDDESLRRDFRDVPACSTADEQEV